MCLTGIPQIYVHQFCLFYCMSFPTLIRSLQSVVTNQRSWVHKYMPLLLKWLAAFLTWANCEEQLDQT